MTNTSEKFTGLKTAGFFPRVGVHLVNFVLTGAILAIPATLFWDEIQAWSSIYYSSEHDVVARIIAAQELLQSSEMTWGQIIWSVVFGAIVAFCWMRWGREPGHAALGMSVVTYASYRASLGIEDKQEAIDSLQMLSIGPALVRSILGYILCMVTVIGFIWIFFDRHNRGWHDLISGSVVVYTS